MRTDSSQGAEGARSAFARLRHAFLWALPFAAVWWALTAGEPGSWAIGAPVVVIASWASMRLATPPWWRFHPLSAISFLLFFFWRSLLGGADVAWRALAPSAHLDPAFLSYRLRLPEGPARVIFASTVNLLPGTLCAELAGDVVTIHALNACEAVDKHLQELEWRMARLFHLEHLVQMQDPAAET